MEMLQNVSNCHKSERSRNKNNLVVCFVLMLCTFFIFTFLLAFHFQFSIWYCTEESLYGGGGDVISCVTCMKCYNSVFVYEIGTGFIDIRDI